MAAAFTITLESVLEDLKGYYPHLPSHSPPHMLQSYLFCSFLPY